MKSIRPLLGTYVVVEVSHPDDAVASRAVNDAFAAIAAVQQQMSAFDRESDVSRINRLSHHQPVTVHPWTVEVLQLAQQIHRDSGGLFDCGIAPQLADWNMLPQMGIDYPQSSIASLLVSDDGQVSCRQPTRIDLGGIAKGYAVDRAVEAALASGAVSVMVNAGGDLRVAGDIDEPIYLRHPSAPSSVQFAGTLRDGAIATSGTYYSKRLHEGQWISAIVDPSSRAPLDSADSYSVLAPHCAAADALTKVLALSRNAQHPCLKRHGAQAIITHAS